MPAVFSLFKLVGFKLVIVSVDAPTSLDIEFVSVKRTSDHSFLITETGMECCTRMWTDIINPLYTILQFHNADPVVFHPDHPGNKQFQFLKNFLVLLLQSDPIISPVQHLNYYDVIPITYFRFLNQRIVPPINSVKINGIPR